MNPVYASKLKRACTGRDEPVYVYRVIAEGKIAERVRLVACRAGGWREYESEDLGRFKTRDWYAHTTPVDALLHFINKRARWMVGSHQNDQRRFRDEIENAIQSIQRCEAEARRAQQLKDARMCGY